MSLKSIKLKKKTLLTAVITAVISVFISFIAFYLIFLSGGRYYLKLKQLDFLVENFFYGEIDTSEINDMIIRGYVAGLNDKYARYYTVEETNAREDDLDGKGQGIGVIISKHPDNENIFIKKRLRGCACR